LFEAQEKFYYDEEVFVEYFNKRILILGDDHVSTVNTRNNLAG
jgi:hypothetical protein